MKPADLERELTRQLEQDGPLSSLAASLRDEGPDATELASLASRLNLQGIALAPSPVVRNAARWKWLAPGSVGVALVVAWWGWPPIATDAPSASSGKSQAPPSTLISAGERPQAAGPVSRSAPGEGRAPAAPQTPAPAPAVSSPGQPQLGTTTPLPALSAALPGSQAASSPPPSPTEPRPLERSSKTIPAPATGSSASEPPARAGGAPSELELLRDARLALRQSPARALELTERHSDLYPRGLMTQERELLAISALVAMGRRTAALSRAASFERSFANSPYRKQIGELLR